MLGTMLEKWGCGQFGSKQMSYTTCTTSTTVKMCGSYNFDFHGYGSAEGQCLSEGFAASDTTFGFKYSD